MFYKYHYALTFTHKDGPWLWRSWQSGCFWHVRSAVQIPTSARKYFESIYLWIAIQQSRKDNSKEKEAGNAPFKKTLITRNLLRNWCKIIKVTDADCIFYLKQWCAWGLHSTEAVFTLHTQVSMKPHWSEQRTEPWACCCAYMRCPRSRTGNSDEFRTPSKSGLNTAENR